jgi:predicted GNAT family acetyltransferase
MPHIRILQPGDEAALEAFLLPRIESSMFLLGNMRTAGLVDGGQPYQGTYAAAFADGQITGVVAHYWNGILIPQAPQHLAALCAAAVEASGRAIRGLIGPREQVTAAQEALGISDEALQAAAQLDDCEKLYVLPLADLVVPAELQAGQVRGRRMEARDLNLLTGWRAAYSLETLGDQDGPKLRKGVRASLERSLQEGRTWVLEAQGQPVATSSFNTAIAEAVQVGGVWTPPALRSRGYGRAAVAASLLDARAEGAKTAILFTGEDNVPAQKAYEGLGFRHVGEFRLILLREPLK